jgi:hypothetical protein
MGASLYYYRLYRSKAELEGTDCVELGPGGRQPDCTTWAWR